MKMYSFLTKKMSVIGLVAMVLVLLTSCGNKKKTNENSSELSSINNAQTEQISLLPSVELDDFPKAELKVSSIKIESDKPDSVVLLVNYKLNNFTLTENTDDENCHTMANSEQGQHIHFILDNTPYLAVYKPEKSAILKKGTQHYLLSFLSRSYHKSLKYPAAAVLNRFEITEDGKYKELPIEKTPMLFFSRPKGEYKGTDTKSVLLDFYLFNVVLEKEGYKVKALINNQEFIIDNWQAYTIEGLPMGETTISLTLIDKDGMPLEGQYTATTRKIILAE